MKGLPAKQDAYGRAMLDYHEGKRGFAAIIERDDGHLEVDVGIEEYFWPFAKWSPATRKAMKLVHGRALDVGAGAGRVALYLQEHGHDAVAIDNSPAAIKVCKGRGVKDARVLPFEQMDGTLGRFDSIVMMGNNFGLFGSSAKAKRMLRRLVKLSSDDARIIGQTLDPYQTDEPVHLSYHRRNRSRGRMAGQIRLRARYKNLATPWIDYLFVSVKELNEIVDGTGWSVERIIPEPGSPIYIAVLEKL